MQAMSSKLRVAVVGATGYTGAELVRLLQLHPHVSVTVVTSSRHAGEPLARHATWLGTDLVLEPFVAENLEADVAFLCQENGFARQVAPGLAERIPVVDLSADFRFADGATYELVYGFAPVEPGVPVAYGLPELGHREAIRAARLVANPGCHVVAASLAIAPFARAGVLAGIPVVDSKTGVSGAGRSRAETAYLFSELHADVSAYKVSGHRHVPEIEQNVGVQVRFTPHLLLVARGIYSTAYLPVSVVCDPSALLREAYAGEPFVTVVDAPPHLKDAVGSNRVVLHAEFDPHTNFVVVTAVLDNLVKGASG